MDKEYDFCKCNDINTIMDGINDKHGYWDICTVCGKRIKGAYWPYADDEEIEMAKYTMTCDD